MGSFSDRMDSLKKGAICKMKEILEALKTLGVEGSVTIRYIDKNRTAVYVNGEYFGIWDTIRKTFVD